MLERMYHKRLRGYSELGYQVKIHKRDDGTSRIYDSQEYAAAFAEELSNAARSILIISPYIQKGRITGLLSILENAVSSGVRVIIYMKALESYRPDQQPGIASAIAMIEIVHIDIFLHRRRTKPGTGNGRPADQSQRRLIKRNAAGSGGI